MESAYSEVRKVATTIEETFRKNQPISQPTQDFWDAIAKAAIERIDILRAPKPEPLPEEPANG